MCQRPREEAHGFALGVGGAIKRISLNLVSSELHMNIQTFFLQTTGQFLLLIVFLFASYPMSLCLLVSSPVLSAP